MRNILLILILLTNCAFPITLDDLSEPKPLQGRLSNTDKVESASVNKKADINEQRAQLAPITKTDESEIQEITQNSQETNSNYADLSLKKLASDVSFELDLDSAKTTEDLSVLWQATTARSETMKYTIYKLSNPDEDKPNESTLKKILKPIASFTSLAGASVAGDPFMATGALIGGGLMNAFMKDDKEVNYKFSRISDADMVLLVRKIDDLQKKLLDLYVDYKTKEQLAKMTKENFEKREIIYKNSQDKSKEELIIADVYYRNAKTNAQRAQDEYLTSRAILENLVGLDALKKIEEN